MRSTRTVSLFVSYLFFVSTLFGTPRIASSSSSQTTQTATQATTLLQQPTAVVGRDAQALSILTQVVTAAGGAAAITGLHDYIESGSISYSWAGQDVAGSVQVYGRGTDKFRLDAGLSIGTRSWAVSNQAGAIREPSGYVHEIPFHNTINSGSLTMPYFMIWEVLNNSAPTAQYLGPVVKSGRSAYQVRVQAIPTDFEPSGLMGHFSIRDLFVDATTFQVLGTVDMVHPDENFYQEIPHEITFSDYRTTNGILAPFSIQEMVGGQHTWTISLDSISVNPGLSDSTFQF